MSDAQRLPPAPTSRWSLLAPYLADVAGPFVGFAVVHAFGAGGLWAMAVAGTIAGASTAINTLRRRKLDGLGILVLIEIAASIGAMVLVRDPRLLLVRPSLYTGIAAAYIAGSAFARRPVSFVGARMMVARRGPERLVAFEKAWDASTAFRRTHRAVTLALAFCLAVDSVLRVVITYRYPLARAAWLSHLPHLTALALMMLLSALAGRRFRRLVEEQMRAARSGERP